MLSGGLVVVADVVATTVAISHGTSLPSLSQSKAFYLLPKLGFLLKTISYGMNFIVDDLDVFKLNAIFGKSLFDVGNTFCFGLIAVGINHGSY